MFTRPSLLLFGTWKLKLPPSGQPRTNWCGGNTKSHLEVRSCTGTFCRGRQLSEVGTASARLSEAGTEAYRHDSARPGQRCTGTTRRGFISTLSFDGRVAPCRPSEVETGLIETSLNESQGIFMASNRAAHPPSHPPLGRSWGSRAGFSLPISGF